MTNELDIFSWTSIGKLEPTMTDSQKKDYKREMAVWHSAIKPFLLRNTDARKITDATEEQDRDSCIDAWVTYERSDRPMPIARRIQFVDDVRTYETFTIRASRRSGNKTEYEKLMDAYEMIGDAPKAHVQAYVNESGELRLAIVDSRQLFEFLRRHESDGVVRQRENYDGGSVFLVVNWCDLEEDGIRVTILGKYK